MKLLQIVPREGTRLYGAMVKKQAEIRSSGAGLFPGRGQESVRPRDGRTSAIKARSILNRACREAVEVAITSPERGDEARLLSSFLGWLDRHFGEQLSSINIQYQQAVPARHRR